MYLAFPNKKERKQYQKGLLSLNSKWRWRDLNPRPKMPPLSFYMFSLPIKFNSPLKPINRQ